MKHKNKTQLEVYRAYLRSTNVPELYKVKLYIDYSPERSHWNEVTLFFLEEYRIGKILQPKLYIQITKVIYAIYMLFCALGAQSCSTFCDPVDCSLSGPSVHGISQARNTEVDCPFLL